MQEPRGTQPDRARPSAADAPSAFRLLFAYEGLNVSLLSSRQLEMITPPSDPLLGEVGPDGRVEPREQTGFWFELRDANNRTLYRRIVDNPIKFSVSLLSQDPLHPFTNRQISNPKGDFQLIAPALDQATTIVLFGSPETGAQPQPAEEIGRFPLRPPARGGPR